MVPATAPTDSRSRAHARFSHLTMDHQKKRPDDFDMTTLFGVMAALAIVIISASAAGQHFFGSDIPEKVEMPSYELGEFRISSLLPVAAYKNLTENLTQEIDDVILVLDRQLEESRSDDDTEITEGNADEAVPADGSVFSGLVTTLVPAAQTRKLVATKEGVRNTVAGAMEFKGDVEKVTETISKKRAVVLAMYGVWKTVFSNAWTFLKRASSAVWSVFEEGSHYPTPDSAEGPISPSQ